MGRLHKLEADVDLDVIPHQSSPSSSSGISVFGGSQGYEGYCKEFFFGKSNYFYSHSKKILVHYFVNIRLACTEKSYFVFV